MKRYVRSSKDEVDTYVNRRNPNKYVEVKKYDDGHTVSRQYMKWDTPQGEVKNYTGARDAKRGRYFRTRKNTLNQILDDYDKIEECDSNITSSSSILSPWKMIGEYSDGYATEAGGNDIGDCLYKLENIASKHGDLIWYGGVNDDNYVDGELRQDVLASTKVDEFMRYHEDPDNYGINSGSFDRMYSILDKYGDASEDVDVVFRRATEEDQDRMIDLIRPR